MIPALPIDATAKTRSRGLGRRSCAIAVAAGLLLSSHLGQAADREDQAASARAEEQQAWLADFETLKSAMERNYANLAWFASPEGGVDLTRLDRETRRALAMARTPGEAKAAVRAFVRAIGDGHFSERPFIAAAAGGAPAIPRKAFDAADPASSCAALGFLPSAPISFSAPVEQLEGFRLLGDGMSSIYRTGVWTSPAKRKIGIVRVQNFFMRAFPAACSTAFSQLVAEKQPLTERDVRVRALEIWYTGFAEVLRSFGAAGVDAVIVDIGDNSGGNDSGDDFPRILTDQVVRSAPVLMVNHYGATYLGEVRQRLALADAKAPSDDARQAIAAARQEVESWHAQASRARCDLSWVWRDQRSWQGGGCRGLVPVGFAQGPVSGLPKGAFGDQALAAALSGASGIDELFGAWTGPVYLLINGKTYSSAEMMAAVVKDNGIGKLVGQRTGGDGCGWLTNADEAVLPRLELRFRMPNCVRLRKDGSNEVAGIAPDLVVAPTNDIHQAAAIMTMVEADAAAPPEAASAPGG